MAAVAQAVASKEVPLGQTVIQATNLTKAFSESVIALENASFKINKGDFVSLVGPSGCGKSTLLRLVAGLIKKTSGSITVHGKEVSEPRADTGMMFQRPILLEWRTSVENVLLPSELQGKLTSEDKRRAMGFLELVGLKDFEFTFPRQLSGGMQQRVALARLLQTGADILLLDEPFGALDNQTRGLMQELLLGIWERERKTVLFVTHDIEEAIFLASRVVVMTARPGRIKAELPVDLPHPRHYTMKTSPEFSALKAKLTEEIRAEAVLALEAH
jgi:ABC-type nitrate/sulfonate/bicarbonate transport system ATPase subunit